MLEVGNVLAHYGLVRERSIVDKYEREGAVLNVDVCDFNPSDRFDAIVSISTLEHVGWDEHPRDPPKVDRAMLHLQSLLAPGGAMLITCPLGANAYLDRQIRSASYAARSVTFMSKGRRGWHQVSAVEAFRGVRLKSAFNRGSNRVWIAEFGAAATEAIQTPAVERDG